MDVLLWVVPSLLAIAAATTISSRLGIAAPLLLTVAGIVVSMAPFIPAVTIDPEWILAGVLPPLLYSAAISMPTMEFRRDLGAISGLSILLVVISSLLLGALFAWLIPGLGLAGGIALGAIVSPTDAVAISIVKKLGVSPRAVAILEGESLLNDASALVILRSALVGMAVSVSLWGVLGDFLYAIVIAVVIGWAVGELNLRVRAHVTDSTVNTVISFTIPFIAALPAEHLGASGLVAAVVAGLVTGSGAPHYLSPRHRLSDSQNWRTIELVLEGAVFLIMGLELQTILQDVRADNQGITVALGLAALALLATILIRAAYVAPLLAGLRSRAQRGANMKESYTAWQDRLSTMQAQPEPGPGLRRSVSPQQAERLQTRLRRQLADIDYFLAEPLGWREGTIVVWAGMRGVVTLAAAQTLPDTMPSRSLLIFIAFLVAVGSLLLQGSTLPWLIRWLHPAGVDPALTAAEQKTLDELLNQAALQVLDNAELSEPAQRYRDRLARADEELKMLMASGLKLRLEVIEAQRNALLDARDNGQFSAAVLSAALENLDADQISLELRKRPANA